MTSKNHLALVLLKLLFFAIKRLRCGIHPSCKGFTSTDNSIILFTYQYCQYSYVLVYLGLLAIAIALALACAIALACASALSRTCALALLSLALALHNGRVIDGFVIC